MSHSATTSTPAHLQDLYREMILDHSRHPHNYQTLPNATHKAEGYNPLCGDHLWVYLRIAQDRIEEVTFQGDGCAICKASASVMSDALKNLTPHNAQDLFTQFHNLLLNKLSPDEIPALKKLGAFAGVWQYPARVKCASLAWHTMKAALDGNNSITTEHE